MLLHGLLRTRRSMARIARRLRGRGHGVVNCGYPARAATVDELARRTVPSAFERCDGARALDVVTHSLGAILLRRALRDDPTLRRPARVVMLGPPNHGSEIVDVLGHRPGFAWMLGPAGRALGTTETGAAYGLGPAPEGVEVGIVAGDRSFNPILSPLLPGPDDGAVTVASTRLQGMADHVVVPVPHPLLPASRRVIDHVAHFLDHGAFR